jgi:hypothetical protein
MRKVILSLFVLALSGGAELPYGYEPDWESDDSNYTFACCLGDFNGDGWQSVVGEVHTGDGQRKVFYVEHFPAREISAVRVDDVPLPDDEWCCDPYRGWVSLGFAPAAGEEVALDYAWSDRLDFYTGNCETGSYTAHDRLYYHNGTTINETADWVSDCELDTVNTIPVDIDADGDLDLLATSWSIELYYNDGDGLESEPSWQIDLEHDCWVYGCAVGDYDDDGYQELAVNDYSSQTINVYDNNAGVLDTEPCWTVPGEYRPDSLAWGDMDGDGDLDLAAGNYDLWDYREHDTFIFENVNGTLTTEPTWTNNPPPGSVGTLAWGDFNGDGLLDLFKGIAGVIGTSYDNYSDIFYGSNSGLPTSPSWETSLEYTFIHSCSSADLGLDGYQDILLSGGFDVWGFFHYSYPDLEIYPSYNLVCLPDWRSVALACADINNDGYPDLLLADWGKNYTGYPNFILYHNGQSIATGPQAALGAAFTDDGVLLDWALADGAALLGLELSRRPLPHGDWLRLTAAPLDPARRYWLDDAVRGGCAYEYRLSGISEDGRRMELGSCELEVPVRREQLQLAEPWPNPAVDSLNLAYTLPEGCASATLTIYDLSGRRIFTQLLDAVPGRHPLVLDVAGYPQGVYIARLAGEDASETRRFVISR